MIIALTREISDSLGACELTHLPRVSIDLTRARRQHAAYEDALRQAGCEVVSLPPLHGLPDAVFVEDVAIVLDELAIVTRPGAESRRPEADAMAGLLAAHRATASIEAPGTIDGGDVLRLGHRIYVGLSGRSNQAGIGQLRALAEPFGYGVTGVPVSGCLHLKSAVTEIAPDTILVNPAWVDPAVFGDVQVVAVDPDEPYAANGLLIMRGPGPSGPGNVKATGVTIYPDSFPRTRRLLEARGIPLLIVDVSELQKAEGAVTCCSLILEVDCGGILRNLSPAGREAP